MELPIPRINGKVMSRFINRQVFIILDCGSGSRENGNVWKFKSSDGVDVYVSLPPGENIESQFIHVEGKVTSANLIEVMHMQPITTANFDVANYNQSVELQLGKFSHLFG